MYLKSLIVFFNNVYLAYKFLFLLSFSRTQDVHFSKNSEKFVIAAPLSKLFPQKLHQCYILKKAYCMQNCVQFHAKESDIELSQNFWKNRIADYMSATCIVG